ncbi:MAG: phosphotransferase [Planctomycetes bacterium]|nr:phosphotransferase [Planctomycetota bacterium]
MTLRHGRRLAARLRAMITPSLIQALYSAHGRDAVSFERIPTGKFNESWLVSLSTGIRTVIRIAPPDDAGFLFYERRMMIQEPAVHDVVHRNTSIPVADILVCDHARSLVNRDFIIMSFLPGTPLSDALLSPAAVSRALHETGSHLASLHRNCRAGAYGYLGEHRPMPPCGSWADAFRTMWSLLVEDIRSCGFFDASEARTAVSALDARLRLFDRDVPSSLLHMDIWGQNILVDPQGHVTGIVDWDRALWGDVEIEFAVLDYCGVSTDSFWKGYGAERDLSDAARVRGVFYYLYELQKYIVIRALRTRSPAQALACKHRALALMSRLPA